MGAGRMAALAANHNKANMARVLGLIENVNDIWLLCDRSRINIRSFCYSVPDSV